MMADKLDRLLWHAADLGMDVAWDSGLPEDCHGYYEDRDRLIVLNYACTQAQALAALAHEVGHGIFGDRCSTEAVERRADEMGASLVIEQGEYAAAEAEVGPHAGALARHLGVTRDLVLAWRRWWRRTGHLMRAAS
jgi:hypothetical protein